MTKEAALQAFFEQFLPSYAASAVPEGKPGVEMPYLTYELITGAWEEGEVGLTVNLWYYTTSEAAPNAKVREISSAIGMSGTLVPCDDGAIWFKRGSPWAQSMTDSTDTKIKRRYLNVTAEYLTPN